LGRDDKKIGRPCNFQVPIFSFLQFAIIPAQKQIRMARMTPNEANKKPFVIIRIMGSERVQADGFLCEPFSGMKFAL
jgi:hypothetical protein